MWRTGRNNHRNAAQNRSRWQRQLIWEQLEPRIALAFSEFVDPNPNPGNQFGAIVLPLKSGNVVITSPLDDGGGTNAGAVYLFDGKSGALISTLRGSTAEDRIGNDGVFEVGNGNFVVRSLLWDRGAIRDVGAITWGSGQLGVSGTVNSQNSLIGSTAGDQVGLDGIEVLAPSGNYLVRSSSKWDNGTASDAGAITWGNGNTGVQGSISSANSLVGSSAGDKIGSAGVVKLSNGNYVVQSPLWDNGTTVDAGAATWGSGSIGVSGQINSSNSLVGSKANDKVSNDGVTALTNGNFVVNSTDWDNGNFIDAGAVTWGNGSTGSQGIVGVANSYVGDKLNMNVGSGGVTALSNGNYVVLSKSGQFGGFGVVGAVTWGNGAVGSVGAVSASNSLVARAGTVSGSGIGQVLALTNGNYLVVSPEWPTPDNALNTVGAVTWRSGVASSTGVISESNSLIGSTAGDFIGSGGVVELTNGNYVVISPQWGANKLGAVTWANGVNGTTGKVTAANSLVGARQNDNIGKEGVVPLTNGNYVVRSSSWDNGSVENVGAVTWMDGTKAVSMIVSAANSLVGSSANDTVGSNGVWPLDNGNYVTVSSNWSNGTLTGAGAVTWGDGKSGVAGIVQVTNSVVGASKDAFIGSGGITKLQNSNYLILSPKGAGSVTWARGNQPTSGIVSSSNSLVGMSNTEALGSGPVVALSNGNYVVGSPNWKGTDGTVGGAATFGNGTTGVSGFITKQNSIFGLGLDAVSKSGIIPFKNGNYLVITKNWTAPNPPPFSAGAVTLGNGSVGTVGQVTSQNSIVGKKNFANLQPVVLDEVNNNFYAIFIDEDGGKVRVGSFSPPSISILPDNTQVREGNAGTTPYTFTLTRTGKVDQAASVSYSVSGTSDFPADAADFGGAMPTGTITIDVGQSSVTLSIAVRGDTKLEPDETFLVTLSAPSDGLELASATAQGKILDDDLLPGDLLVTNTSDSGSGSLRDAMAKANMNVDKNRIVFDIPGTGTQTINLLSQLPQVVFPLVIDATTQPGFAGIPLIELNGQNAGNSSYGLFITAGNSTVKGLTINRFSMDGIGLYLGDNNIIEGNFLGTDATGTQARGNQYRGVGVYQSANNQIGGSKAGQRNLISGNLAQGIYIEKLESTSNKIQGNLIGTDLAGTSSLKNHDDGILINASAQANIVGTDSDGTDDESERNIISGNGAQGIHVFGVGTNNNVLAGNWIGLNASGDLALPNMAIGVLIGGGAKRNRIGTDSNGISDAVERNILSGNRMAGLWFSEAGTEENWAAGNLIGTDSTGTRALANDYGVVINNGVKSNRLGTNADGVNDEGERNVVSGNRLDGVFIQTAGTERNTVSGNYIGTSIDGATALPNGSRGISVHPDATNNLIGGSVHTAANVIAFNGGSGITMDGTSTTGNEIRGNHIFANGGLGIDLNSDGVTLNDPGDIDSGPNHLQNFPTLSSALVVSGVLMVEGQFEGRPNSTIQIELFGNDSLSSSQYGEGKRFLIRSPIQTDSSGNAEFSIEVPQVSPEDAFITATAIDVQGNTSEFSRAIAIVTAELRITLSEGSISENGGTTTATVIRNTPTSRELIVNLTVSDATAATVPSSVTIPAGATSATFTLTAVNDSIADGNQVASIQATATGLIAGASQVTVVDDEIAILLLNLADTSIPENGGTTTGTVTRNTPTTRELIVNLTVSDATAATVPSSVTIPAGATSATFTLTAVNDSIADGNQVASIQATASGLVAGTSQVTVVDDEIATLLLTLADASIPENGGTTTGTVTRNTPTTGDLIVNLAVSDATAATVPSSVTIPAGATSATFTLTAVNNSIADGNQVASIQATATGLVAGTSQVTVVDDEIATLLLTLVDASIPENGGTTTGTVTRNTPTTGALIVNLTVSDAMAATVPSSVTIPAGATSTTFTLTAVNDSIADGNQVASIQATATGLGTGTSQVTVVDDEIATLLLTLADASIPENGGTTTGTVTRNTLTTGALIVNLAVSDATAATVPSSVTIPAGATSATFTLTAVNDSIADGNQVASIQATATSLGTGTSQVTVIDDDPNRPWHNYANPLDVDADGTITPLDVLSVINFINFGNGGVLPETGELTPPPYVDVDQDGTASPLDVLNIINHLNRRGEGEQSTENIMASRIFGNESWIDNLICDEVYRTRRRIKRK